MPTLRPQTLALYRPQMPVIASIQTDNRKKVNGGLKTALILLVASGIAGALLSLAI